MKKLFYLFLIVLGVIFLFSCEDEDEFLPIDPDTDIEVTDTTTTDTTTTGGNTTTYVGGIVISTTTTDVNSMLSMYKTDMLHSIPTSNSGLKSSKSVDNYIILETTDGTIDTLSLADGMPVLVNNVKEIYSINVDFLLFVKNSGGININYEMLRTEYTTVYDSVHIDSSTSYVNVVDTTFVDDDMWLVYYDTLDVVVDTIYDTHNYDNILYSLTDGTFHDLVDDINISNDVITNSFNNPLYKNNDKSKFYYLNSNRNVIEVDLSSGTPFTNTIYDSGDYGDSYSSMYIFNDNIIYQSNINEKFFYITKNGTHNELDHTLLWNEIVGTPKPIHFHFMMNDELYFVIEDWDNSKNDYIKFIYDETNDSIYVEYDKSTPLTTDVQMGGQHRNIYEFSDDNFNYYFDRHDKSFVSISKTDLTYYNDILDISNNHNDYDPIELQTKMAKFVNGFIIYTSDNIYSVNTNTKSKSSSSVSTTTIASGYRIKDMATDIDGNVVFFGKNPSGENIKGVINSDNTITETPVEYDSNGVLITNI